MMPNKSPYKFSKTQDGQPENQENQQYDYKNHVQSSPAAPSGQIPNGNAGNNPPQVAMCEEDENMLGFQMVLEPTCPKCKKPVINGVCATCDIPELPELPAADDCFLYTATTQQVLGGEGVNSTIPNQAAMCEPVAQMAEQTPTEQYQAAAGEVQTQANEARAQGEQERQPANQYPATLTRLEPKGLSSFSNLGVESGIQADLAGQTAGVNRVNSRSLYKMPTGESGREAGISTVMDESVEWKAAESIPATPLVGPPCISLNTLNVSPDTEGMENDPGKKGELIRVGDPEERVSVVKLVKKHMGGAGSPKPRGWNVIRPQGSANTETPVKIVQQLDVGKRQMTDSQREVPKPFGLKVEVREPEVSAAEVSEPVLSASGVPEHNAIRGKQPSVSIKPDSVLAKREEPEIVDVPELILERAGGERPTAQWEKTTFHRVQLQLTGDSSAWCFVERLNTASAKVKTWTQMELRTVKLEAAEQCETDRTLAVIRTAARLAEKGELVRVGEPTALHLRTTWARLAFKPKSDIFMAKFNQLLDAGVHVTVEPSNEVEWKPEAIALRNILLMESGPARDVQLRRLITELCIIAKDMDIRSRYMMDNPAEEEPKMDTSWAGWRSGRMKEAEKRVDDWLDFRELIQNTADSVIRLGGFVDQTEQAVLVADTLKALNNQMTWTPLGAIRVEPPENGWEATHPIQLQCMIVEKMVNESGMFDKPQILLCWLATSVFDVAATGQMPWMRQFMIRMLKRRIIVVFNHHDRSKETKWARFLDYILRAPRIGNEYRKEELVQLMKLLVPVMKNQATMQEFLDRPFEDRAAVFQNGYRDRYYCSHDARYDLSDVVKALVEVKKAQGAIPKPVTGKVEFSKLPPRLPPGYKPGDRILPPSGVLEELPWKIVRAEGIPVRVFLDTGAQCSIIAMSAVNHIQEELGRDLPVYKYACGFTTYGGNITYQYVIQLWITTEVGHQQVYFMLDNGITARQEILLGMNAKGLMGIPFDHKSYVQAPKSGEHRFIPHPVTNVENMGLVEQPVCEPVVIASVQAEKQLQSGEQAQVGAEQQPEAANQHEPTNANDGEPATQALAVAGQPEVARVQDQEKETEAPDEKQEVHRDADTGRIDAPSIPRTTVQTPERQLCMTEQMSEESEPEVELNPGQPITVTSADGTPFLHGLLKLAKNTVVKPHTAQKVTVEVRPTRDLLETELDTERPVAQAVHWQGAEMTEMMKLVAVGERDGETVYGMETYLINNTNEPTHVKKGTLLGTTTAVNVMDKGSVAVKRRRGPRGQAGVVMSLQCESDEAERIMSEADESELDEIPTGPRDIGRFWKARS